MRISDWSSDVCSSDLYVAPRSCFGQDIVEGNVQRLRQRAPYLDAAGTGSVLHSGDSHFRDIDPGRQLGLGQAPISMPRSEEHTSELQSLMRISYAVFCL